jgi:hypothetical protein
MKKSFKPLIILTILFATYCQILGQNPALPQAGVYNMVGKTTLIRNGKSVLLKQKDLLYIGDYLQLPNGSFVRIFTQDYKFIEINKPGKYKFDSLYKKFIVKEKGLTAKYAEMVYHELFQPQKLKEAISPKTIGRVKGAVTRECNLFITPNTNFKSANDTINIIWQATNTSTAYLLTIEDENGKELFNIVTKDTLVTLLKKGLLKSNYTTYRLLLSSETECKKSETQFTIFSSVEKQNQVEKIVAAIPKDDDTFFYYLKIADALGNEGWYLEAFEYHKKANKILEFKE